MMKQDTEQNKNIKQYHFFDTSR